MRYEAMGKNRTQRLNVPQLLGGLNTATEAALIEDDELSAVCNLTFDHGALVTREAVRAVGDEAIFSQSGAVLLANEILRQPIEIDGVMSTVVLSCKSDTPTTSQMTVQVISLEGECLHTYTMDISGGSYSFAVAPADKKTHGGAFLLYYHGNVYSPDDTTGTMKRVGEDELYAPLVMVGGTSIAAAEGALPSYKLANGVMYEGFNTLTNRYRVQITPSVESGGEYYALPTAVSNEALSLTMEITTVYGVTSVSMTPGGEAVGFQIGSTMYNAQAFTGGYVSLSRALPVSTVSNTVTITCTRAGSRANGGIYQATVASWFGGTANKRGGTRLFLASRSQSKLMWSDVNNPFYFPENNYMYVGDTSQKITALEKQGDMLVIFKEREIYYTTYVQGEIDAEAVAEGVNVDVTASQAYFPLTQLSPQIGCRCPHSIALCRDRLVWLDSDARIYTLVVSGQYSERNVREIGQKVRPFLLDNTTEAQRKNASAIDHKGKYRLMIGSRMVEFDYNDSGFVNVSGYSSGERAARNIAWMAHKYGFPTDAVQTLVSDGADRAIIISTISKSDALARVLYMFDTGTTDDRYLVMAEDGAFQAEEHPITTSLTTKTYEFGDPAAFKRIGAFYPMMQAENAELYFIVDGVMPSNGKRYQSADTFAHLVLPCVHRCRTFGLRIDAEGKVCIKGLRMQYSMFGSVK